MPDKIYNVLFLCTGNSARSILGECLLNHLGAGRFNAFSAGSMPKGEVHPQALALLKEKNYETENLQSKSWDVFSEDNAPQLDFVFTVCGNAANETCPVWLGTPASAHWGLPDPAAVTSSHEEQAQAFEETYRRLTNRINAFIELPFDSLDQSALKKELDNIGEIQDA